MCTLVRYLKQDALKLNLQLKAHGSYEAIDTVQYVYETLSPFELQPIIDYVESHQLSHHDSIVRFVLSYMEDRTFKHGIMVSQQGNA